MDYVETLLQISLFKECDRTTIENFLAGSPNSLRKYQKGDFIALQGDPCRSLYLLYKGRVKAHMENDEGKQLVIDVLDAPEILAPAFIFGTNNRFPVNVEADSLCEVLCIDRQRFLVFMHENISVMQDFIREISDRAVFLSKKLNEFALQGLKGRLLNYIQVYGSIHNQQEVANIMGVARPSLARALSELIAEKKIRVNDKSIEIL